jgi:hypothetical protein
MIGDLVYTEYSSGCLRSLLLTSEGVREPFDPKHSERGALNEERYERALMAAGADFSREEPFKIQIAPDAVVSGRVDFVIADTRIDELKSTESTNVIREVIKNGNIKQSNVAQLVVYIMAKGLTFGNLIYSAYKRDKKTKELIHVSDRVFSVQLMADGGIYVDEKKFEFTAGDVVSHLLATARVIRHRTIAPRPYKHADFSGPCKFCVFAPTCGLYDSGILEDVEDFVASAKTDLLTKAAKSAKVDEEKAEAETPA